MFKKIAKFVAAWIVLILFCLAMLNDVFMVSVTALCVVLGVSAVLWTIINED